MPEGVRARLGPAGRVGFLAGPAVAACGAPLLCTAALAAVALAWAAVTAPRALGTLRGRWFLGFAALTVVPAALWTQPRDLILPPGVALSPAGLAMGAAMLGRGLLLWLTMAVALTTTSLVEWSAILDRVGLRSFAFTLGVAFHTLPAVQAAAGETWSSLKMRGGLRRHGWQGLHLLAVTIIADALRRVDEIEAAARMRGYDPSAPPRRVPGLRGLDFPAIGTGLALAILARVILPR